MSGLQLNQIRWLNPHAGHNFDRIETLHVGNAGLQVGPSPQAASQSIDASTLWLMPAMVDSLHHLAAPSAAPQSSISHELTAAWGNGFQQLAAAPDTQPCIDNPSVIEWIEQRTQATQGQQARLHLLGALTQGLQGQQLSNMASLMAADCVGLSQADKPLPRADLLRQALRYAADLDICIHLQANLSDYFPGCAHDGARANTLGLSGIPAVSEALAVATVVELVRDTGCRVHLSKLSSATAVDHLRLARAQGLPLSGDVALFNLLLSDQALCDYDTVCHLSPPLRDEHDRLALLRGVADGVISAICSDHRPLGFDDKFGPFPDTRAGANGIDGFLPMLLSLQEHIDALTLARCSSAAPAQILGTSASDDWLIVAPAAETCLDKNALLSQCLHSPWLGQTASGRIVGRISGDTWTIDKHWQQQLGV